MRRVFLVIIIGTFLCYVIDQLLCRNAQVELDEQRIQSQKINDDAARQAMLYLKHTSRGKGFRLIYLAHTSRG